VLIFLVLHFVSSAYENRSAGTCFNCMHYSCPLFCRTIGITSKLE
jgi:hypothetical protein